MVNSLSECSFSSRIYSAALSFNPEDYYRSSAAPGSPPFPPELQHDPTRLDQKYWDVERFQELCRYHIAKTIFPAGRVLDVGCGVGYGTGILSERAELRVVGLDILASAIEYGRLNWGGRADFVIGSSLEIPFPDQHFDAITCFEHYEHVEPPANLLRELHRVLRDGGHLMISTFNQHNLRRRILTALRFENLPAPGPSRTNPHHVREVSTDVFRTELSSWFTVEASFGQHLCSLRLFCACFDRRPPAKLRRGVRKAVLFGHRFPRLATTIVLLCRKRVEEATLVST